MDYDDAVPPPIRRSSQGAFDLQQHLGVLDSDSDDDAVPPPIALNRRRSASLDSPATPTHQTKRPSPAPAAPPVPDRSPLRPHTEPREPRQGQSRHARNFSHPFRDRFAQAQPGPSRQPIPHRGPPRATPYRQAPRFPPSLRRWSSLETIESVAETPSPSIHEDVPHRPSIESSSGFSTVDEESNTYSGHSDGTASVRSIVTPNPSLATSSSTGIARPLFLHKYSSGSSMLRKLKPNKFSEPLVLPEHLEIEKRVSVDQTSHRSNSSSSTMTISSGQPSMMANESSMASRSSNRSQTSINSQDWKSSEFDISGLTESELKKCKKKGINPALFAEMKAARKGKWVSPIAGNTVL